MDYLPLFEGYAIYLGLGDGLFTPVDRTGPLYLSIPTPQSLPLNPCLFVPASPTRSTASLRPARTAGSDTTPRNALPPPIKRYWPVKHYRVPSVPNSTRRPATLRSLPVLPSLSHSLPNPRPPALPPLAPPPSSPSLSLALSLA